MVIFLNLVLVIEIVLVFGLLMFIHELGHFIFAKRAGIFVREFSLGLGPKIFSVKKNETQYSLRILPFAAYVRMAGEDPELLDISTGQIIGFNLNAKKEVQDIFQQKEKADNSFKVEEIDLEHKLFIKGSDEEENIIYYPIARDTVIHYENNKQVQIAPWDRQFGSKSVRAKFAAVLAGPVFNIILAIILFFALSMMTGIPTNKIIVQEITENSPAEEAGLIQDDTVLGIEGMEFKTFEELIMKIQTSPGENLKFIVDRNGERMIVPITPKKDEGQETALIGVKFEGIYRDATFSESASNSLNKTAQMTAVIFQGFKMILSGHVGMDDVVGPVGIIQVTSDFAQRGIADLTWWGAVLSLYLGIFNLLPIPALDGSRLLFLTLEGIRGKPVDPQKESMVHLVGFAFLMLLMIVVTFNDISRLFQ